MAESGKITHERIAEPGFTDPAKSEVRELIEQLEALEIATVNVSKSMNGAFRNVNGAKNLNDVKQIEDLLKRIDQLEKINNETKKQKIKLTEQEMAQNQIDNQLKKDRIALLKNTIAQTSNEVGVLKKLELANAALRAERNKLIITDKDFEANLKRINSQIDSNNRLLVLSSDKQKAQTLNVGNYDRQLGVLGKTLKGFGALGRIFSEALGIDPVIFTGIREAGMASKDLKHILEGSKLAHEGNAVAIEAEGAAQEASTAASIISIPVLGLYLAAATAIGAAIWYIVGGKQSETEATKGLTAATLKLMKVQREEAQFAEEQKNRSDESGQTLEEHKSAQEEANKQLQEEVDKRKEQIEIDEEFNRVKKGGLNDLQRELELLKEKNSYTSENFNDVKNENEKFRKSKEIADKEQEIRKVELKELKDRQKALGDFAVGDLELQQQIADKENEIRIGDTKSKNDKLNHTKTLMNISIALQKEGAARRKEINDEEIKYEIEALTGKFGSAEKVTAEQELVTKIELGSYNQAELDAWVALLRQQFDERKSINDKEIKYELEAIAGKHGKAEEIIAKQELRTKVALSMPLTDEEKAEWKKEQNEKIDEAKKEVDAITSGIADGLRKRNDIIQTADQKNIDQHERMIDVQTRLAAEGKDNVLAETIAQTDKAEEKKIQDAKRAAKQQETIAEIQVFTSVLSAALKSDKPFFEALGEAGAAEGVVKAMFSRMFSGSAYDGTEDTGKAGDLDSKGGKAWILHPHERVLTGEDNAKLKGMSNKKLVENALAFENIFVPEFNSANTISSHKEEEVHDERLAKIIDKRFESLQKTIESQPMPDVNLDGLAEWTKKIRKNNITTIIHHKQLMGRASLRLNG